MEATKGERTRRHLIESAAERFAADGYHGTSYSDLIAASGLSKGAHYFHFRSKQELALEVYRVKQAEVIRAAEAGARGESSPLGRFFRMLEVRTEAFAADRSLRCLPRLSTDFARDPELSTHVAELHGTAIRFLSGLLREAGRAGELRPEVDPDVAARTIFAALVGIDEVSERETGGRDLMERGHELFGLLRHALAAPTRDLAEPEEERP